MSGRRYAYPLAALFALALVSSAFGQLRLGIQSGYGLRSTRDSVFRIYSDSIAIRNQVAPQISDSLDRIPRTSSFKDSIIIKGVTNVNGLDTSAATFFGVTMGGHSAGAYRWICLFQAPTEIQVTSLRIAHEFDSGAVFYAQRDTAVGAAGPVTIPRGAYVFACYSGAGSYALAQTQSSQQQRQEVAVFYVAGNNSAGTLVRACEGVQVPLILGAGWAKGLGFRGVSGLGNMQFLSLTLTFKKL